MRVHPFRGYRYAIGRERDISKVVAPPYDQISPAQQDLLYALSPANIVRVSSPRAEGGDRAAAARDTLERWVAKHVWERDEAPSIPITRPTSSAAGR